MTIFSGTQGFLAPDASLTDEADKLFVGFTDNASATSAMPKAIRCHIRYIRYAEGYPLPHPLHPLCRRLSVATSATSAMPKAIRCHIRYIRYAEGYPLPQKIYFYLKLQ